MNNRPGITIAVAACFFSSSLYGQVLEAPIRVGVSLFAEHNVNEPLIGPTILAIEEALKPRKVEVEHLRLDHLQEALKQGKLDIIISSAGNYRRFLLEGYGLRDLATIVSTQAPNPNYAEGSVFFTNAAREDIKKIEDLRGKKIAANYEYAFSGWQTAVGELYKRGYQPESFFSKIEFLGHGANPVIEAVLKGEADVGVVRACVLENSGLLNKGEVKVLEPKEGQNFQCLVCTDLYPNWTVSTTPNTPPEISRKVTAVVLALPEQIDGLHWSVATDFTRIDTLFKELEIGPYEYLRHFSFRRFFSEYWPYFVIGLLLLLGLLLHGIRSEQLVRKRTLALSESLRRERELRAESGLVKQRLDKIQKIGIVGQMCTMIAHDLKQPLGAAAAYCFALRRRAENNEISPEQLSQGLERVDRQIKRASDVVDQVRSYTKGQRRREELNLDKVVSHTLEDLKASYSTVEIQYVRCREDLIIEANTIELEIILVNLVKNAAEALQGKKDGKIIVSVGKDGNSAKLCVADNGVAISDGDFAQISKLSATTSKEGGLGFGLSIVTSLVEDLGGRAAFQRAKQGGFKVTILLPLAQKENK